MLILESSESHGSLFWPVLFAACPQDECKEASFVAACFILGKFLEMLRAVY